MIDIHSHLLPCVDDGSISAEKSFAMLREAASFGVTDMILTPHSHLRLNLGPEGLKGVFDMFKNAALNLGIGVNLYLGQEIYFSPDFAEELKNPLFTLNGTRYVLAEFDFYEKTDVADAVYELSVKGYKPIVCHVERYTYLTISDVKAIKECGGEIQVNADSIINKNLKGDHKRAKAVLKEGLCDYVASDMHYGRVNCMAKAYGFVCKKYGKDTADKLFTLNARKIIGE